MPAVISRTAVDSFYFDDSVVRFFTSGDVRSMADAILDVIENPELRTSLATRGLEYARRTGWDVRRNDYLRLVDTLSTETIPTERIPLEVPIV